MKIQVSVDEMIERDLPDVRNLAEQLGYPITAEALERRYAELSRSHQHKLPSK